MPLPDERPRQSVANLIGRFEQQNKRSSVVLPRSPSVLSHNTGGSIKSDTETVKREWPPVAPVEVDKSNITRSAPAEVNTSDPVPEPVVVQEKPPEKVKEIEKAKEKEKPPEKVKEFEKEKEKASKVPPSSFRTPTKTSSRPSLPNLKPQTTGGSTPSTRKQSAGPKSTPATPAKTPSTARPKTPSSGLFAPTAASLAKARNSQLAPPPAVKRTISAASADRLSKPTAASLSKARTPSAPPARGKPASRGATRGAKPKSVSKATKADNPPTSDHINGHAFEETEGPALEEQTHVEDQHDVEEEHFEDPVNDELAQHDAHANGHDTSKGTQIEDMVTLLEAAPRPQSASTHIPDQVNEIPDELNQE